MPVNHQVDPPRFKQSKVSTWPSDGAWQKLMADDQCSMDGELKQGETAVFNLNPRMTAGWLVDKCERAGVRLNCGDKEGMHSDNMSSNCT